MFNCTRKWISSYFVWWLNIFLIHYKHKIYKCILSSHSCNSSLSVTYLPEWLIMQLIMQAFVFSGVITALIMTAHDFSHRPIQLKKCLKSIYCFLRASKQDDFHIILKQKLKTTRPSSQKSCKQMFCMCFMALFQWLQNFSFSLTTHFELLSQKHNHVHKCC